jgi:1-acyl-sn-glycerol-3-phosphate acyltransferase
MLLYKWLIIIPFLGISTLLLGTIIIIMSVLGQPDLASRVFGTLWARLNMAVTLVGIDVMGRDNVQSGQSYVIVANHQSLLDIYLLYGCTRMDIKWVMKKELRAVPVLGLACEMMGHIIIDRSDTEAALASIASAKQRISNGMSVVFFPEGTRSRDGTLGKFKKGAFRLAQDLDIPVLPITINGTNKILPSDTLHWRPGKATMQIHEPIFTAGQTAVETNELVAATRNAIADALP